MATIRLFRHYVRLPLLLLFLVEASIYFGAVYLSVYIRFWDGGGKIEFIFFKAIVVSVVMMLTMMSMGMYQSSMREGVLGFFNRLMLSFVLGTIALVFVFYVFPFLFVGRGVIGITVLLSVSGIVTVRLLFYIVARNSFRRNIVVLGSGEIASKLTQFGIDKKNTGFNIVGFLHVRGEKDKVPPSMIMQLDSSLNEFVTRREIDEIVVAIDDQQKDFLLQELLDCRLKGITVTDLLTFFEKETSKVRLDLLHPGWLIFSDGFQRNALREFNKRSFDILASLILFLVTWPIMLATIVAIVLESGKKAPVLYRQIRIGEGGIPFQVLKFRSMRTDAEISGQVRWATENDDRITKVGKFIRKVRIDELPQIFNVLLGDMSFVGPRPERPEFVVSLTDIIAYYAERHNIKPGLTGWAQLNYPYGASEQDSLEKLQYDLYYIKNHSLFLDMLILLQTVAVVIFGKGR